MPYILYLSRIKHCLILVFILSFTSGLSFSQEFGGFPLSVKWNQIATDTCRIIFPRGLEKSAQRVANLVHYLKANDQNSVGDRAFHIDLVLHNQTTISNGFVGLAPWKSFFQTTPLQNSFELSALPWLDLLAVHEYRHVIQLSTARRGITNVLYHLFGEETWSGAANLAIPDWFLEGDAVWAETQLSRQGRGRMPDFMKGYRAFAREGARLTYSKARNGSIKDYVPDHYRLGYLFLDYGHEKYGEVFWKEVFMEASRYNGLFYPFSRAIKKRTGYTTDKLFDQILDQKESKWTKDENGSGSVVVPVQKPKTFTDYHYPRPDHKGGLIFFKRSYEKIGAFYSISPSGEEQKLVFKGQGLDSYFGMNSHYLTWSEYTSDARWMERDYSNIWWYNIQTGQKKKITTRKKYFSPQPSKDGTKIVTVAINENLEHRLQIIESSSGDPIATYTNTDQWVLTYPQWSHKEDQILVSVRNDKGEMTICVWQIGSQNLIPVLPFTNRIIGTPSVHEDYIFYSASTASAENIFALHIPSKSEIQLTEEPLGAFQPSFLNDTLYYTSFTTMGHLIKKKPVNLLLDTPRSSSMNRPYQIAFQQDILESVPQKIFPVKSYRKGFKLMNVHSWGFDYDDPNIILRGLSNNVLNDLQLSAGARYNYDLNQISPFAEIAYGVLPVEIGFNASGIRRSDIIRDSLLNYWQIDLLSFMSTDLNLSSGPMLRSLAPVFGISNTLLRGDLEFEFNSLLAGATFTQKRLKARKNLFTKNGLYINFAISKSIDRLDAQQVRLRSGIALSGLRVNDNLILHVDYKKDRYFSSESDQYQFSNPIRPRGFANIPADEMWRFAANYHLPIVYPDWGLWGIFYIYRIRANLYLEYLPYEFSNIVDNGRQFFKDNLWSSGIEIVFDTNLGNSVDATFGFRWVNPTNNKRNIPYNQFEFFVPVYRF